MQVPSLQPSGACRSVNRFENGDRRVTRYEYDDDDREVLRTSTSEHTKYVSKTHYEDDGLTKVTTSEIFDAESGQLRSSGTSVWKIDADGRIQSMLETWQPEGGPARVDHYEAVWSDACASEAETYIIREGDQDGPVVGHMTIECDEQGRAISSRTNPVKPNTEPKPIGYTIRFREDRRVIESDWDGDGMVNERMVEELDEYGHAIKTRTYNPDGDKTGTEKHDYSCWPGLGD